MLLAGKTAILTGATGVIGGAVARLFAREGCSLLLSGRSNQSLATLRAELQKEGARAEIFPADVSLLPDVRALFAYAEKTFESLDILVTAAGGYGEIGTLLQCDPEAWTDAIRINLFGTAWCVTYALPLFKKKGTGRIIAFAGGGDGPLPHFTSYASSKGAVLRFVESAAQEFLPLRISINAISPGLVNSGFVNDLLAAGPSRAGEEKFAAAQKEVAGEGGSVSPEHAASLALFLASEAPEELTGKNISAVWDRWRDIPSHLSEIASSDIYNWRRVKPKDRGYDWK